VETDQQATQLLFSREMAFLSQAGLKNGEILLLELIVNLFSTYCK
jgi:hypothetical protein